MKGKDGNLREQVASRGGACKVPINLPKTPAVALPFYGAVSPA